MKISAYSEIIASAAVIISLIYVGLQVRQNTKAIQTSTSQSLYEMHQEKEIIRVTNREFAELSDKIKNRRGEVSSVDSVQWLGFLNLQVNLYESAYTNMEYGTLDPEMGESWLESLNEWVCIPLADHYWMNSKDTYVGGFRELVDTTFEQHPECRVN